jgi:cobalt/nickel transport system permease protein
VHIPDGYLSPTSCGTLYAASAPFWVVAARRVKKVVKSRYVPLLAIGAAYCFLVMMFNVPIPDGTTAHAIGGVLVAVLLGPWAAVIAVSTALLIQALFFGDGGLLAFGANCFNMAIVMPFVGYGVYRLVASRTSLTSPKRAFAAALGGYIGINVAAFVAAVEFGLQPTLFHRADGTPLYAPFHLAQTIPAMMLAHLLVAGVVEAALTFGVITYLQRANLPVLRINRAAIPPDDGAVAEPRRLGWRWGLALLGVMAVLTPLGLIAPGGAFGESSPNKLDLKKYHLDAVPSGLRHYAGFWHHALFKGYDFSNDQHPVVGYLVSAAVGLLVIGVAIGFVAWVVRMWQRRRQPDEVAPEEVAQGAAA